MYKLAIATILTVTALGVSAQTTNAPQLPHDEKIDRVSTGLQALTRIVHHSDTPERYRPLLLAIVDADIDHLRTPREDGTYRWASLQREEASRVKDEKSIERVHTEAELRYVTLTAPNAYRVLVTVPPKRGVFAQNNRVYVRNIIADVTGFDGKTVHHELPLNAWINPGDSNGVALPEIGKSVKATAELGVENGQKEAVAEVALIQAKLVDDPQSPYFPAVKRLVQIRELASGRDPNKGALKTTIDEALLSLPGELEKRTAEQQRAAEERRQLAATGTTKGAIAVGDATPDVLVELMDVQRLMGGNLTEQSDARARLQKLIDTLRPPLAGP
ncbi:MAG TPA: hypothetical protein VF618_26070 [Thermoanaerobaculia bacterium]